MCNIVDIDAIVLHDMGDSQGSLGMGAVSDRDDGVDRVAPSPSADAPIEPTSRTIQSVDRALVLLQLLNDAHGELALNDFARATGLHKSTVHRILASLQAAGIVERDHGTGRYMLGLELIALSGVVLGRLEVLRIADPHLRHLADITQETVNLGIRHRNDILNVEQIPGPRLLRSLDWLGKRKPLHLGAAAKALLAHLPDEDIHSYITAVTQSDGVDLTHLWPEITEIRRSGVAINDGAVDSSVFAIGAPIFGATGQVVASIAVAGERDEFSGPRTEEITELVLDAAATISRQLGFRNQRVARLA